jgi:hypothetical protein
MALNPFFSQGLSSEQNLVQDLINEQLKIYGIDVMYIPRKMIRTDKVLREVQSSKFDDNFIIEAYVNNYEGYAGAGDIMTKFGVSLRDEVTLTISKERFEEFIGPIMASIYNPNLLYNDEDEELVVRPREGDLIYFPLGQRLFEVKFVEHEKPFYQLGKTYVYEVICELFEYEDEIMDTSVAEVDELIKDVTTTLYLIDDDYAQTAVGKVGVTTFGSGYVQKIVLLNDGNGYIEPPLVSISTSPVGVPAANAKAVAITTSIGDAYSIYEVLITNTGYGYTEPPTLTFVSAAGKGSGAIATCIVNDSGLIGISSAYLTNSGKGYFTIPSVTISPTLSGIGSTNAVIAANLINVLGVSTTTNVGIVTLGIRDAGYGYNPEYDDLGRLISPTITISPPSAITNNAGVGTYQYNEIIIGATSGAQARVRDWDINSKQLLVSIVSGEFIRGESIVGSASSASWVVRKYDDFITEDPYAQNDEIENEGIDSIDFTQDNPFGVY